MSSKYGEFFSMFNRISQVHVFILYGLSLINNEYELSTATKKIFERIISLLHTPIEMEEFHNPNFENFRYLGESKATILTIIKKFKKEDLREFLDFDNSRVKTILAELVKDRRIIRVKDFVYIFNENSKFEKIKEQIK
jgi:hypothetical protein